MSKSERPNVVQHLASLRRYALALTRHESDAEDLVQDALVKAYEQRSAYRQAGSLSSWLMAILHNTFIDGVRARNAATRRNEAIRSTAENLIPAGQNDSVRLNQIRAAFLHLPEEQRAAMHLVAIEDMTYAEAAEVLGVPVGTVLSRISRARERLRAIEDGTNVVHLRIIGGKDGP